MLKNILALIVTFCLTAIAPAQVAVAVGGGWGGVAVGVGGYGGYGGAYAYSGGYYGGYYGGYVAPVGGWYPFAYSSSFYASPVPQVIPIVQPNGPYTVAPCYVQPVVQTQQQPCKCQKQ
jgi:hypothetical protein